MRFCTPHDVCTRREYANILYFILVVDVPNALDTWDEAFAHDPFVHYLRDTPVSLRCLKSILIQYSLPYRRIYRTITAAQRTPIHDGRNLPSHGITS